MADTKELAAPKLVVHLTGEETDEELRENKRLEQLSLKYKHQVQSQVDTSYLYYLQSIVVEASLQYAVLTSLWILTNKCKTMNTHAMSIKTTKDRNLNNLFASTHFEVPGVFQGSINILMLIIYTQ